MVTALKVCVIAFQQISDQIVQSLHVPMASIMILIRKHAVQAALLGHIKTLSLKLVSHAHILVFNAQLLQQIA